MLEDKITKLLSRLKDIEQELGRSEVISNQKLYIELTQEHARLSQLQELWDYFSRSSKQLVDNEVLLTTEEDPELRAVIKEDMENLRHEIERLRREMEAVLVPPDPRDHRNIILELRAGTGGDEAALFVGDCVRMYQFYATKMGWKAEPLGSTPSEAGGYKEYVMGLSGKNVFRFMQYEAGTHRVQRVPETEAQGRVHTSAITVAVLLEPSDEEQIAINEKDLHIETYRASGAGGQHVNVTDSAVRITHLPTKTVVTCQDERSQHKNKEKAMRFLNAKLLEQKRLATQRERADLRQSQIGSGDRSERIRTYNFPQNRVTDHRIDLTLYKLDQVMEGDLEEISQALVAYYHQLKLSS